MISEEMEKSKVDEALYFMISTEIIIIYLLSPNGRGCNGIPT